MADPSHPVWDAPLQLEAAVHQGQRCLSPQKRLLSTDTPTPPPVLGLLTASYDFNQMFVESTEPQLSFPSTANTNQTQQYAL